MKPGIKGPDGKEIEFITIPKIAYENLLYMIGEKTTEVERRLLNNEQATNS